MVVVLNSLVAGANIENILLFEGLRNAVQQTACFCTCLIPIVLTAMVAQKGFEEKMIINYIVLRADGLHLRTFRHAVQMGCKKVLQLQLVFEVCEEKGHPSTFIALVLL